MDVWLVYLYDDVDRVFSTQEAADSYAGLVDGRVEKMAVTEGMPAHQTVYWATVGLWKGRHSDQPELKEVTFSTYSEIDWDMKPLEPVEEAWSPKLYRNQLKAWRWKGSDEDAVVEAANLVRGHARLSGGHRNRVRSVHAADLGLLRRPDPGADQSPEPVASPTERIT